MDSINWNAEWNTKELYQKTVQNCDYCGDESPIPKTGVACGPILRLIEVDYTKNVYRGSMLIVMVGEDTAPVVKFWGQNVESGNGSQPSIEGEFRPHMFYSERDCYFYRYPIELELQEAELDARYTVDGESKPHYRFYIPSRTQNFNTISYSCNGFSLSVDTSVFKGSMWFDILNKHAKVRYHVMLGGGDQIYADSIKLYCASFKAWLEEKDPFKKFSSRLTPEMRSGMDSFYLKAYLEWYGFGYWKGATPKARTTQACFPIAMATIPSINVWDDHDIIDGFGSYSHSFMKNEVFSAVGKAAYKYYMLFQHHVSIEEKTAYLEDPMWILGKRKGEYIGEQSHSVFTRLGPKWGMLGLDCRTERKLKEIVRRETYDRVFARLEKEVHREKLDHLMVMLGVPIAYPRLVWLEWLFSSRLLAPLKYLSKKGIIASSLVNEFNGDVEVLDDLNDHWCARHHKKERNYLIARLQDFGAQYGVRITILSGDVHLATVGRFRSKLHTHHLTSSHEQDAQEIVDSPENDPRLIFNVVSSAVVNTPPPNAMANLLQRRSGIHHFDRDTDEDVVPLFKVDTDGHKRTNFSFMNRRNWSDLIPVEHVLQNPYLRERFKLTIGDQHRPGLTVSVQTTKDAERVVKSELGKQDVTYPVTPEGIVVTLHIEKDNMDPSSDTVDYSLVVPELADAGRKLSHTGMKHGEGQK
ncbi:LAMI_0F15456g1_1 [Lachancea mirantina]|uniref:LAMI_0F15456g1_1 n=1 Tax=Lachancea mirantina TaxID=1230905 RepID=A0A1G4K4B8_9SACH|nr:LAMI_0F15456g1_1 [Lachancea mirantina]